MIHVDDSTLLAYLDGQAGAQREEVATHVAACGRCAAELRSLTDMTADLRSALELTDVPAPMASARARFDTARRDVRRGAWPAAVRLGPFRVGMLQAAVLALLLAGVAGAAIPGSPLRLWLESAFGEDAVAVPEIVVSPPAPAEPAAPAPAAPTVDPSESRVPAVDGRVVIALNGPPAGTRLIVRVDDVESTSVEAVATPTAREGALDLNAIAGDRIVVTLPRTIASARIDVDGQPLVHREGATFTQLPANARAGEGGVVITLGR